MPTEAQGEQDFVKHLAEEFRHEGYELVAPEAIAQDLPVGYVPDLAVRRGDEIMVIEVKSAHEHRSLEQVRLLKQSIESKPNWKFRLYAIPPSRDQEPLRDNLEDIERLIKRAKQLDRAGEFEAASVMLWIAIEISLRRLLTDRQSRPNPGVSGLSMARSLTGMGDIDEDDLSLIENAWRTRNLAVHGFRLTSREPRSSELIRLAQELAERVKSDVGVIG